MKKEYLSPDELPQDDKFHTELFVEKEQELKELLEQVNLDVEHIHINKEKQVFEATVFATLKQIDQLKDRKIQYSVYENLSEIGRMRQKEVGKGDRFDGGKISPKGLGIKK
jgi:hypothetical protein